MRKFGLNWIKSIFEHWWFSGCQVWKNCDLKLQTDDATVRGSIVIMRKWNSFTKFPLPKRWILSHFFLVQIGFLGRVWTLTAWRESVKFREEVTTCLWLTRLPSESFRDFFVSSRQSLINSQTQKFAQSLKRNPPKGFFPRPSRYLEKSVAVTYVLCAQIVIFAKLSQAFCVRCGLN